MSITRIFSRGRHSDSNRLSRHSSTSSMMPAPLQPFPKRPVDSSTANTAAQPPSYESNSCTNPYSNPSPRTRRPQDLVATTATPADPPPDYAAPIAETADDPYAFLASFDTVFLIDDSGSMAGRGWRETAAALSAVAPICAARDKDGIDVHFLNHPRSFTNLTSAEAVQSTFTAVKPGGGTPTGTRLHTLLKPYLLNVKNQARAAQRAAKEGTLPPPEIKPLNIIVITDGAASDDVESVICTAARKLEDADAPAWQVGIQFFQVGNEPGAAEALRELDDELVGDECPRDIVDTVPWDAGKSSAWAELSGDKILKCVLGAVVKKLDRRRNSGDSRRAQRAG